MVAWVSPPRYQIYLKFSGSAWRTGKKHGKIKFSIIPTWSKKYFSFIRYTFPGEFLRFLCTFPGELVVINNISTTYQQETNIQPESVPEAL
jgi:hypothetical protein